MKLVDILARELKVWPEGAISVDQSTADREVYAYDGTGHLKQTGVFLSLSSEDPHTEIDLAQWQTAVDALKASENAVPEWNGEGLPPAGIECEVMGGGLPSTAFDWEHCTILLINEGADGKNQVCTRDFRGDLAIYYPDVDPVYFRPIRTPEQIAAEEREAAIKDMAEFLMTISFDDWVTARELYDAGYRKQVKP